MAVYDYPSATGKLVLQVVRYAPKTFRQRRPDPTARSGWKWSTKGIEFVPYRLPGLLAGEGGLVFIVEGEKDADALVQRGLAATCNPGGAGKWPRHFAQYFVGRDVVILPDNDDAGRAHAGSRRQQHCFGGASCSHFLALPNLPEKGDVSDWLAGGGTSEELRLLAAEAHPIRARGHGVTGGPACADACRL